MRYRSYAQRANLWDQAAFTFLDGRPEYQTGVWDSAPGAWDGNRGPLYINFSEMWDELSPSGSRYTMNPCIHTKSQGAFFDSKFYFEFGSWPTPCNVHLRFFMEYSKIPEVPSGPWGDLLDDLANTVEGHHNDATMLSVSLLEGVKTLEMMKNPFNFLKPNFRRKARKLSAALLSKKGAGIWLESYYGWKSLYQDVTSSAKALAIFLNESPSRTLEENGWTRLTASSRLQVESKSAKYALNGTSESLWNYALQLPDFRTDSWTFNGPARLTNYSHDVLYTVGCSQLQSAFQRIQNTRRFLRLSGLANWRDIRDTIWEVIPFSFVVDWFVNTHGIWAPLNNWRLQESDIKEPWFTTKSSISYDAEMMWLCPDFIRYAGPGPYMGQVPRGRPADYIMKSVSRGSLVSYHRESGLVSPDAVDAKFLSRGLKRIQCLNGLALLTQLFVKPK